MVSSVAVGLQARTSSFRLFRKALLKLGNLTVTEHAMRSLSLIPAERHLLLVPFADREIFAPLANRWSFTLFEGPEEDVLRRYALAMERYPSKTLIRATGDNPLVSAKMASSLLAQHQKKQAHYSAYQGLPLGTGVEIVEVSALEEADRRAKNPYDRMHVCPYLYRHPDFFKLYKPRAPAEFFHAAQVTLDTIDDYERIQKIISDLGDSQPIEIHQLISYFKQRTSC